MNSSTSKSFGGCKQKTDEISRAEESGWTSYLQDFSLNSSSDNYGGSAAYSYRGDYSRFGGGPSLHSDAASPAAWKERGGADAHDGVGDSMGGFHQRLKNLKKSKKKTSDPDLEDTASSPVNSPKVVTVLKPAEINQKKNKESNIGNYSHYRNWARPASTKYVVKATYNAIDDVLEVGARLSVLLSDLMSLFEDERSTYILSGFLHGSDQDYSVMQLMKNFRFPVGFCQSLFINLQQRPTPRKPKHSDSSKMNDLLPIRGIEKKCG
nr:uncharacterized protein LOC109163447 isoform X2 [Ipomoea batatas]